MAKKGDAKITLLAKALKLSRIQIWRLVQRGMPLDENLAREWRAKNVATKTGVVASDTGRLRRAQAFLAELDARERIGQLAPTEDYQIAINEAMVILASQFDGLPGRTASQLATMTDAAEIRRFLLNEIRRIRAAAADRLEGWARVVAGSAVAAPAAGSDA